MQGQLTAAHTSGDIVPKNRRKQAYNSIKYMYRSKVVVHCGMDRPESRVQVVGGASPTLVLSTIQLEVWDNTCDFSLGTVSDDTSRLLMSTDCSTETTAAMVPGVREGPY